MKKTSTCVACIPQETAPPSEGGTLLDKLRMLNVILSQTNYSPNNIILLDNFLYNFGISGTLVFKRESSTSDVCSSCEFYIDSFLVGLGELCYFSLSLSFILYCIKLY